ncbi:MAG: HlyC/CorC family transporter, partial [Rhodothermaceae bacterium]|nr:HlyC/CorC family transporter [Rhodothermaceae bacterium]
AEIGKDHGSLEEDEHGWIQSLLDFGDTTVRAIMVNRLDISALPITASLKEALELIRICGHSRLPLYKDHLDNIQGVVYAKDLLPYVNKPDASIDWTHLMRPPIFVPLGRKLDDLLQDFQHRKTHLAIVVDEYGGTAGLVTLDDVLEEVVGEMEDEHDEVRDTLIIPLGNRKYKVDARINLDDLNDAANISLPTDTYEFETLGGLIFHLAGDIPEPGYTTVHDRMEISVDEVENNRIRMVHIRIRAAPKESNG